MVVEVLRRGVKLAERAEAEGEEVMAVEARQVV